MDLKSIVLEMEDKKVLQKFLLEVWAERPDAIRILLEELLKDSPEIATEKEKFRRAKIKRMIDKDFEKYDEVFRNLSKY